MAIVDINGQQAFGYTRDVLDLGPLEARWRAFNWNVHVIDGHDFELMKKTISELNDGPNGPLTGPHVILAQTTFGKGVSFMERQLKWHYRPLSAEDCVFHGKTAMRFTATRPPVSHLAAAGFRTGGQIWTRRI